MSTLILLRHGQSEWNLANLFTGWVDVGLTPKGEAPMMRYRQDDDVVEIAVLVGDYSTVDDPEAQRVLKKLKYAKPQSLEVAPEESNQALASYRTLQKKAGKNKTALTC